MVDDTTSQERRARILGAIRDRILRGTPLPNEAAARRLPSRSKSARGEDVGWFPINISQNRVVAIEGGSKESNLFGGKSRVWPSKAHFDDELRATLIEASVHEDEEDLPLADLLGKAAVGDLEERQALFVELVRERPQQFLAALRESQTFLVGMSGRSGIAATAAERMAATAGNPSRAWSAATERVSSSRLFYVSYYGEIARAFGLEPKGTADVEAVLTVFAAVTAAAADGLGQAAVYDERVISARLDVDGHRWGYLSYLVGTLMNDLFTIEGQPPVPSLQGHGGIQSVE